MSMTEVTDEKGTWLEERKEKCTIRHLITPSAEVLAVMERQHQDYIRRMNTPDRLTKLVEELKKKGIDVGEI